LPDDGQQIVEAEGLFNPGVGAKLRPGHSVGLRGGYDHSGDVGQVRRLELIPADIPPVHRSRHPQIKQEQRKPVGVGMEMVERLFSCGCIDDQEPVKLKELRHPLTNIISILNDENRSPARRPLSVRNVSHGYRDAP